MQQQIREGKLQANLQQGAGVAAERGKEYGTKGWGFMKSAYASMAQQVEHLARDNGYQLDLGALRKFENSKIQKFENFLIIRKFENLKMLVEMEW